MDKSVVVYYTHFFSENIKIELDRIAHEVGSNFDIFAMGCCSDSTTLDRFKTEKIEVRAYTREDLQALPYKKQMQKVDWKTLRRNPDLAIMRFFVGNPDYDHYWIVENDVRFSGDWMDFFRSFEDSSADLIAAHVVDFPDDRDWVHWKTFSSSDGHVEEESLIRAFLPVARVSKRLMRAIDERCQRGWTGHPEVLWPTIARSIGGSIEEIGGLGLYVPQARRGKFYHSAISPTGVFFSTFNAWPMYDPRNEFYLREQNILWHPVKDMDVG